VVGVTAFMFFSAHTPDEDGTQVNFRQPGVAWHRAWQLFEEVKPVAAGLTMLSATRL
jgi:hypothetical protein